MRVSELEGVSGRSCATTVAGATAHAILVAIAALAVGYLVGVAAWLWSLRDGISGSAVSAGLVLVGAAVLLAWLAGFAGAGWPAMAGHRRKRTWPEVGVGVLRLADDPVGILRVGLTVELIGFTALVILR